MTTGVMNQEHGQCAPGSPPRDCRVGEHKCGQRQTNSPMKPRDFLNLFKTRSGKLVLFAVVFGGGLLLFRALRERSGSSDTYVRVAQLTTNATDKPQVVESIERQMQLFRPPPPKTNAPPNLSWIASLHFVSELIAHPTRGNHENDRGLSANTRRHRPRESSDAQPTVAPAPGGVQAPPPSGGRRRNREATPASLVPVQTASPHSAALESYRASFIF